MAIGRTQRESYMAPRSIDLDRRAIAMAMADATTSVTAVKDQVRSPGARNPSDRSAVLQS